MAEPTNFEITWRDGAYYVSIPNYKGGTVYTAAEHDRLTRENEALRKAIGEACDFLAERTYGNPARSPGHNARIRLEAVLALKEPGHDRL